MAQRKRDHGGGLDDAAKTFGGTRADWMDLSTGINPQSYPIGETTADAWTALPDRTAQDALIKAARSFWNIPDTAAVLATPGASAPIAMIPRLRPAGQVHIAAPTYNEHAAAFDGAGWRVTNSAQGATAQVIVHPNNPDGRVFSACDLDAPLRIIDESFCDVMPEASLIDLTQEPNTIVLKSFGKFWGLAGLRLGFAIGSPDLIEQLQQMLGPWPVAGPALEIGARALTDHTWAETTRQRLANDATRLDALMTPRGAKLVGGTSLFRLYHVADAPAFQTRLAQHQIWSRVFPYNPQWLRLGLPAPHQWNRLEAALA
ncbi:threonine-phosphate decarboxylase CobD [Sulfitobacter donghicola]|uniref:threonine-phosphate decarboxylase n=1 Tax=Sulfitobacter donghicola DSW-25 = KCTC 12864 = JCM 14565 TaxID=1300350 RepID=A0A073IKY1_9RHOB|nr:threonine-phosphate decarboxylase CobD [Sulfitobacter donghicola]KEJ90983.1 alpha ribazole-5'-P phosphatase [Sulfitobacter donghicola DSW-25 = KCTC 12864 = JCM 14565]KIN68277.1 Threonine-phosphate decarboxylase [Sulfitobacter donghicola DSW-25 = KCTC 12864 = JCM 14565]